jgi:hypothetical protein
MTRHFSAGCVFALLGFGCGAGDILGGLVPPGAPALVHRAGLPCEDRAPGTAVVVLENGPGTLDGEQVYRAADRQGDPRAQDPAYVYLARGHDAVALAGPSFPADSALAQAGDGAGFSWADVAPLFTDVMTVRVNARLAYSVSFDDYEDEVTLARVEVWSDNDRIVSCFIFASHDGDGVVHDVTIAGKVDGAPRSRTGALSIEVRTDAGADADADACAAPPDTSQVPADAVGNVSVPGACSTVDGHEMAGVCIVDSRGDSYPVLGDGLNVTPADVGLGVYFRFASGFAPRALDVSTDGVEASVLTYAARLSVQSQSACCPEDDEANRVMASAVLDKDGGLLVAIQEPLPAPTQVSVRLVYSRLFKSRLAPPAGAPCDLSPEDCAFFPAMGWLARFYVGGEPSCF